MPCPSLVVASDDGKILISISADDSCGVLDNYSRFNVWYFERDSTDECEDGFNLPKIIFWLAKILAKG